MSEFRISSSRRRRVESLAQRRDAETTILTKFAFWRGLGGGANSWKIVEKHSFFLGNSTTIKSGNFANFIVRDFVVICQVRKSMPKHRVFGRDIPGTSGTQTSGYPGQKLYASGLFLLFQTGCPGIWVGTSRTWKDFMQENFGLIFRTLVGEAPNREDGIQGFSWNPPILRTPQKKGIFGKTLCWRVSGGAKLRISALRFCIFRAQ